MENEKLTAAEKRQLRVLLLAMEAAGDDELAKEIKDSPPDDQRLAIVFYESWFNRPEHFLPTQKRSREAWPFVGLLHVIWEKLFSVFN